MLTQTKTLSISAMDLRREPGTYLDRVDLRSESFIVERAGKPKAVLISLQEFKQIERFRAAARARVIELSDKMQKNAAGYSEKQIDVITEKALADIRSKT